MEIDFHACALVPSVEQSHIMRFISIAKEFRAHCDSPAVAEIMRNTHNRAIFAHCLVDQYNLIQSRVDAFGKIFIRDFRFV